MKKVKATWLSMKNAFEATKTVKSDDDIMSIVVKLEKEEKQRKPYYLTAISMILVFLLLFLFVFETSSSFVTSQKIGLILIAMSGIVIVYFSQLTKIPLEEFDYHEATTKFLQIVRHKLWKRKVHLIIGICLQGVFLIFGLRLLIFSNIGLEASEAALGTFYGCMLAIIATILGSSIAIYNAHYRELLRRMQSF